MDDVVSEWHGVFFADGLGASRLDFAIAARNGAPENVVLAPGVDADHGPHAVIVRQQRHPGGPDHVQNREI